MSTTQRTRYAYDTDVNVAIKAVWCPACGVPYGLAVSYRDARREDHKDWHCPNGCVLHFPRGTSAIEKKAAQLEADLNAARSLAQRESRRRTQAEEQARTADYRARAAKGQLTKTRNRIAAGVCPCCSRTFQNLGRHMAGQHPEYAAVPTDV